MKKCIVCGKKERVSGLEHFYIRTYTADPVQAWFVADDTYLLRFSFRLYGREAKDYHLCHNDTFWTPPITATHQVLEAAEHELKRELKKLPLPIYWEMWNYLGRDPYVE